MPVTKEKPVQLPRTLEDIARAFGLDTGNIVPNRHHQERYESIDGISIEYDTFGRIKKVGGKLVQHRFGDEAEGVKQVGVKIIYWNGRRVKPNQYDRNYFESDNGSR